MSPPRVSALLFDVFGTLVDWRTGVADAFARVARRRGLEDLDAGALADAWRARYQPALETVRGGGRGWVDLDVLHREGLEQVLEAHGIEGLDESDRRELVRSWHQLDPWPDVVPGLARLRRHAIVAACSNAHIALVVAMARRAGLVWDAVVGAEVARAYKPQPEAYLRSARALGVEPAEAMMVAAHAGDPVAASRCGLRTAFIPRPEEHGPGGAAEPAPAEADLVVQDLGELASRLGA